MDYPAFQKLKKQLAEAPDRRSYLDGLARLPYTATIAGYLIEHAQFGHLPRGAIFLAACEHQGGYMLPTKGAVEALLKVIHASCPDANFKLHPFGPGWTMNMGGWQVDDDDLTKCLLLAACGLAYDNARSP